MPSAPWGSAALHQVLVAEYGLAHASVEYTFCYRQGRSLQWLEVLPAAGAYAGVRAWRARVCNAQGCFTRGSLRGVRVEVIQFQRNLDLPAPAVHL